MNNLEEKRFAVLIDADNISPKYIEFIIDEISKEGTISYRRIYGNWTSEALSTWKCKCLKYSLLPIQQFENTTGKNSTDSAMIIDAMDILYTKNVDGFCLCTSDSDFTRLAARLREGGMTVIGMGEEKTPDAFVKACNSFKRLDILFKSDNSLSKNKAIIKENKIEKNLQDQAIKAIKDLIDSSNDEHVLVSTVGIILQKKYPDFDSRNFGCKKLTDLLVKWGFTISNPDADNTFNQGSRICVSMKDEVNK